jgi:hypothetical protein
MRDAERLHALEHSGKLVVTTHSKSHVSLINPSTLQSVEFYPTKGTIVRRNVKQFRRGLDAALKLIGVRAA